MLNEAHEDINGAQLSVIRISLVKRCNLFMEQTFAQSGKKRYLINEIMTINNKIVAEQEELQQIKIFWRRFVNNKLNSSHSNQYFEYCIRTNQKQDTERSLKIINTQSYLTDIEIEAALITFIDSQLGFNKTKIYEKNMVFKSSPLYCVFDNEAQSITSATLFPIGSSVNSKIGKLLERNPFSKEIVNETIKRELKK